MARGAAVVGLLAWLAMAGSAAADGGSPAERDPFARARARKRPVIVWVTALDCDACRAFERDVLADRRVVSALDRVVFETVELSDELLERLDLDAAPALVAFDPYGHVIGRRQGADMPARVYDMLDFVDLTLGRGMDWDAVREEVGRPEPPPPAEPVERVPLKSLDSALHAAQQDDALVLIEFGAVWCRPCRWFQEKILSDPAVASALASVRVVQYDVDTAEGRRAHDLYGGGEHRIPSFVLLDPFGSVIDRTVGSQVYSRERFVAFVRHGWVARPAYAIGAELRYRPGPGPVREPEEDWRLRRELLLYAGYGAGLANHALVGVRGLIPLSNGSDDLRPSALFHGEVGFTTDGAPVIDLTAMGGVATRSGPARVGFFVGTGLSQVGDLAPASLEVPLEFSVDIVGDTLRGAAWARAIWLADEERKHGSDNAPLGTDEIQLGIGVRLPARSPHGVWIGVSYRQLMDDQLLSFTFGTGSAR